MSLVGCLQGFAGPLGGTAAVSAVSFAAGAAVRSSCTVDTDISGSGSGDVTRLLDAGAVEREDGHLTDDWDQSWWIELLSREMELVQDDEQV